MSLYTLWCLAYAVVSLSTPSSCVPVAKAEDLKKRWMEGQQLIIDNSLKMVGVQTVEDMYRAFYPHNYTIVMDKDLGVDSRSHDVMSDGIFSHVPDTMADDSDARPRTEMFDAVQKEYNLSSCQPFPVVINVHELVRDPSSSLSTGETIQPHVQTFPQCVLLHRCGGCCPMQGIGDTRCVPKDVDFVDKVVIISDADPVGEKHLSIKAVNHTACMCSYCGSDLGTKPCSGEGDEINGCSSPTPPSKKRKKSKDRRKRRREKKRRRKNGGRRGDDEEEEEDKNEKRRRRKERKERKEKSQMLTAAPIIH
ncbi:uncharacterized protein [Ptychodera flava]|uniref:uncharacterized protein n=1 Tax=Ptychodera flava TaxID=63121 RepID=UPI00396A20D6